VPFSKYTETSILLSILLAAAVVRTFSVIRMFTVSSVNVKIIIVATDSHIFLQKFWKANFVVLWIVLRVFIRLVRIYLCDRGRFYRLSL